MRTLPTPIERAVIIGASMAGLLAARVLAEHSAEVVLLERDELPDAAVARKGTPHAVHPHGLLARGRLILDTLFPGFSDALVARGALRGDIGRDVGFEADRRRFVASATGQIGLLSSRLAIEAELRRRVRALRNVRFVCGVDVIEPVHDAAARRVAGVRYVAREAAATPQMLGADLVVDCSGRASRSPQWLAAWGYGHVEEERIKVDLSYTSAYFERDATTPTALAGMVCAATPALPRPAVLLAQEPDETQRARWVLGVGGYGADQPPATRDALVAYARRLATPELAALAESGRLIGGVMRYAFAHSQRRRYERMKRFPDGYLVMGDAIASFNPVYGQGMTVAACEAESLQQVLAAGQAPLHRAFFRAAARAVDVPWQIAVGADLALPGIDGPRTMQVRLVNRYMARVFRAAARDAAVAAAFRRVMHMLAPPPSLFAPRILWRVWRHGAAADRHGAMIDRPVVRKAPANLGA
jgi:2-polyprenyl-6-methoxyphenol hydroxylase-like FAD-dependent oxidoreductase